jgi:hypothetical protein
MDTLYSAWNESGWLYVYAAILMSGVVYAVIRYLDWRRKGQKPS